MSYTPRATQGLACTDIRGTPEKKNTISLYEKLGMPTMQKPFYIYYGPARQRIIGVARGSAVGAPAPTGR